MNRSILPLLGGAFFKDTTRVATALRTNDISDNLNLESRIRKEDLGKQSIADFSREEMLGGD